MNVSKSTKLCIMIMIYGLSPKELSPAYTRMRRGLLVARGGLCFPCDCYNQLALLLTRAFVAEHFSSKSNELCGKREGGGISVSTAVKCYGSPAMWPIIYYYRQLRLFTSNLQTQLRSCRRVPIGVWNIPTIRHAKSCICQLRMLMLCICKNLSI